MKVQKTSHINPFGGINFVIEEFDRLKIGSILNENLPALPTQTKYNWRDLLYSFWSIFFCGGDCIEDLSTNLNQSLSKIPNLNLPSPDSILKRMKELSLPSEIYDTPKGTKKHEFSINESLNRLNLKIVKSNLKKEKSPLVLDYDNTLIFTKKSDAKMTYKKHFGYTPGVGIIGKNVVYVENRNGNSDAQTLQQDTLERMFKLLKSEGVSVDVFRADGASYQLSTLLVVQKYVNKFFIKARMSHPLYKAIQQISEWKEVTLSGQKVLRGSTTFVPFEKTMIKTHQQHLLTNSCRLVVTKVLRDDGQIDIFSNEAYNYHAIITNDYEMSEDQVVCYYNQRGAIEKEFDVLKNDFGWNNMPFSKLEQNTVFLLLTSLCRNLYNHIITAFSAKYKNLSPLFRLKKFIFRFICIPATWIKKYKTWKLILYGDIP